MSLHKYLLLTNLFKFNLNWLSRQRILLFVVFALVVGGILPKEVHLNFGKIDNLQFKADLRTLENGLQRLPVIYQMAVNFSLHEIDMFRKHNRLILMQMDNSTSVLTLHVLLPVLAMYLLLTFGCGCTLC